MRPDARCDIDYDLLMKIQRGALAYTYRGVPLLKDPFDLALYPMLLGRERPRTLIEIGTHMGGSALWFADQGALLGLELKVLSVDLEVPETTHGPFVNFCAVTRASCGRFSLLH